MFISLKNMIQSKDRIDCVMALVLIEQNMDGSKNNNIFIHKLNEAVIEKYDWNTFIDLKEEAHYLLTNEREEYQEFL